MSHAPAIPAADRPPTSRGRQARGEARRQAIVQAIVAYRAEHGISPSLPEIAAAVGVRGVSGVHRHLRILQASGVVRMRPRVPRSVVVLTTSRGPRR